jgi:TatD DNase family protein
MVYVDTHCHLHLIDYAKLGSSCAELVAAAKTAGVAEVLCVATRLEWETLTTLAKAYSPFIRISLGLHPGEFWQDGDTTAEPSLQDYYAIIKQAEATGVTVAAIGETGLDYYHSPVSVPQQQERFALQIQVAQTTQKPLIIHTRQAQADTLAILKEQGGHYGVFHCFTEDLAFAKAVLELDFFISFSGIITFKNAQALQAVAQYVPLERILVETDAPYLAPVPYRGRINQPSYVVAVTEYLASLKQLPLATVRQQLWQNYQSFLQKIATAIHQVIDASGLLCPEPIVLTKAALATTAAGEIVQVISTDASFHLDCQVFIQQSKHQLLAFQQYGNAWHALIRKN